MILIFMVAGVIACVRPRRAQRHASALVLFLAAFMISCLYYCYNYHMLCSNLCNLLLQTKIWVRDIDINKTVYCHLLLRRVRLLFD